MKKIILIITVVVIFIGCNKDNNTPTPIATPPTSTTNTNSVDSTQQQFTLAIINDFNGIPMCDIDSLLYSIKINNVEMINDLTYREDNFVITGITTFATRYTLFFNRPTTDVDAEVPFQIEIGVNSNVANRTAVRMLVGWYGGQFPNNMNYRTPCIGLVTYDVTKNTNNSYWAIENPCQ